MSEKSKTENEYAAKIARRVFGAEAMDYEKVSAEQCTDLCETRKRTEPMFQKYASLNLLTLGNSVS